MLCNCVDNTHHILHLKPLNFGIDKDDVELIIKNDSTCAWPYICINDTSGKHVGDIKCRQSLKALEKALHKVNSK